MKLSAFKSKIEEWVTGKFGGVHTLDPPSVGKVNYIIYPVSGLSCKHRGLSMLMFEQVVSVTYCYSRRLTYAQLPMTLIESNWLNLAMGLVNGAECVIGDGVLLALNEIDPVDIMPATNNSDWLVTLRFSYAVTMPLELDTPADFIPLDFNLKEVVLSGYEPPISSTSELLFSYHLSVPQLL
jgi:hypothetical protein